LIFFLRKLGRQRAALELCGFRLLALLCEFRLGRAQRSLRSDPRFALFRQLGFQSIERLISVLHKLGDLGFHLKFCRIRLAPLFGELGFGAGQGFF